VKSRTVESIKLLILGRTRKPYWSQLALLQTAHIHFEKWVVPPNRKRRSALENRVLQNLLARSAFEGLEKLGRHVVGPSRKEQRLP
jgi:hypothetical protein